MRRDLFEFNQHCGSSNETLIRVALLLISTTIGKSKHCETLGIWNIVSIILGIKEHEVLFEMGIIRCFHAFK